MKPSKDKENRSWKSSEHEETKLILCLKEGDRQAFTSLFYSCRDKLLRFVSFKFGAIEDAEDIVQDVFAKIWEEREKIDEHKNFNGYIFKMAYNKIIDNFRKSSKQKSLTQETNMIEDMTENIEDILTHKYQWQIFQEAVNNLPLQQKKVYQMHYEQRKSLQDIADEMNLSLSTVQNYINIAIKNIRKYCKKNYI